MELDAFLVHTHRIRDMQLNTATWLDLDGPLRLACIYHRISSENFLGQKKKFREFRIFILKIKSIEYIWRIGMGSTNGKALTHERNSLERWSGWVTREGSNVRISSDNWLGTSLLRYLISGLITLKENNMYINDMMLENGEWNFSRISFQIPTSLKEKVWVIVRI